MSSNPPPATVMLAVPTATPLTKPVALTVATSVASEVYVNSSGKLAVAGTGVTVSCLVPPTSTSPSIEVLILLDLELHQE